MKQPTFASRINAFNEQLHFDDPLPPGIGIMNPYKLPSVYETACAFYNKFYNDNNKRTLILGINPGRLGSGATGVAFTDPKRLTEQCGLPYKDALLHEPSSAFIYDMIDAFGGVAPFYAEYYISSVCPLGFVIHDEDGKTKNYNYFDNTVLQHTVSSFIEWNIREQIDLGCNTDVCFCLGRSKNYSYLLELNRRRNYFGKVIPLEHPRFIMQYKAKEKQRYIEDYLKKLSERDF